MPTQPDFDDTVLGVLHDEAGYSDRDAREMLAALIERFRTASECGSAGFPILDVRMHLNDLARSALDGDLPGPGGTFPGWPLLAVLRWLDGMMPNRGLFREGGTWRPTLRPGAREAAVCLALRARQTEAESGSTRTDNASLRDGVREIAGRWGFGNIGPEDIVEALRLLEEMRCLSTGSGMRVVADSVHVQVFDED